MIGRSKLIYFNVTALGEPIRYLLSYGGIQFQDHRMEWDEWLQYKTNAPFGQLPILEINGKKLCQCNSICRYLAKSMQLQGKTDWDSFQADAIVDTITDFRLNYKPLFKEENEKIKQSLMNEIKTIHNPFYFSKLETIVEKNGGFFVDGQLTWADIYFAAMTDFFENVTKSPVLKNYGSLESLKKKVDSHPNIRTYRENRPKTEL